MVQLLKKVDDQIHRAERVVITACLAIMSVVVFGDVTHRIFADEQSRLARWILYFLRMFGAEDDGTGPVYEMLRDYIAPPLLALFFVSMTFFAIRSAAQSKTLSLGRSLAYALGIVFVVWVLVRAFIWSFPNGVIWAQPLALVLTLWVGFVGASMCTYEGKHLRVEVADRLWPESIKPYIGAFSNALTAACVIFVFGLSVLYVADNYEEYVMTEGQGGRINGLPILPTWIAYLVLPLSFAIMGLRFTAATISSLTGGTYGKAIDGVAIMLADHDAKEAAKDDAPATSDAATDVESAPPEDPAPADDPPKEDPPQEDPSS